MRAYLEEQWEVLRDEVPQYWPGIPDDELRWVEGDLDRLVALIQLHHGLTDEEALDSIHAFISRVRA